MLRTVLNVTGDAMISTIVAKTEREIDYTPGMIEDAE
jgi:Na+/H+-dicarboxylate symporter